MARQNTFSFSRPCKLEGQLLNTSVVFSKGVSNAFESMLAVDSPVASHVIVGM